MMRRQYISEEEWRGMYGEAPSSLLLTFLPTARAVVVVAVALP
jgi:hypothetical protein